MSVPAGRPPNVKFKADVPPLTPSEREMSLVEKQRYSAETKGIRGIQQLQKKYAARTFILCCTWVCAVFLLLLFQGFGSYVHFRFHLSEPVMLAAIGSTTVNIIGVFLIVVRFIFHDRRGQ